MKEGSRKLRWGDGLSTLQAAADDLAFRCWN